MASDYSPQLPTLVARPPSGPGWLHEIKYDGYRMGAVVGGGSARLWSRSGKEWTSGFPTIVEALGKVVAASTVLDGEVVFQRDDGTSDFGALRSAVGTRSDRLRFYAFDVLELDGVDVRARPLLERKKLLERVVSKGAQPIHVAGHFAGDGALMFQAAKKLGAEGIVSKRELAPYRPGRSQDWQKTKAVNHDEFLVCGYLVTPGAPLAALHLGLEEAGRLRYVGKVGTGFQRVQTEILRALREVETDLCPFPATSRPRGRDFRDARWTQPCLMVEVEYLEMGTEGLRHPTFRRMC